MRSTSRLLLLPVLALALLAGGCGREAGDTGLEKTDASKPPAIGAPVSAGDDAGRKDEDTPEPRSTDLGFPVFATKNTLRISSTDPTTLAGGVVHAVFSGGSPQARPRAVALADGRDWRAVLAASSLMSPPIKAPLILSAGPSTLPDASKEVLTSLPPTGSRAAGGAQLIRVGNVPVYPQYRSTDVKAGSPAALARAIDAFVAAARGQTADHVLVVSADSPEYALPAAAWAAKSGDPILFVNRNSVPPDTVQAIQAHQQPRIYVLGPSSIISPAVTKQLRKLGTVVRVGGQTPVENAIEFAAFRDGSFGFGVTDPGHGMVVAPVSIPPAAAGVLAPLSASGSYGPLLLSDNADVLPKPLQRYLLDIQPAYSNDPVRGVYNRAWIIGDQQALSARLQSNIDRYLEIVPVSQRVPSQ